jgi:adenylosuccinate lyase
VLPEAFLALDGALDIMANVAEGLVVWEATVAANLARRASLHGEREHHARGDARGGGSPGGARGRSASTRWPRPRKVKKHGRANDLIARLQQGSLLREGRSRRQRLDPARYVGRAPEQTDRFIAAVVEPIRARYRDALGTKATLRV